jgi:anti-anti-sigma factor
MLLDMLTEGNVLVVSFKAPQINDTDFLEELEDSLRDLLTEFEQRFLLIDFCEVSLISSRMINSLLQLVKRVRAEGGQVHLCGLETKVERVLKSMKLDRVFDMYVTREEGLVAMKAVEEQFHVAQFA